MTTEVLLFDSVDVLVVGGSVAGVCAALSAGRAGSRVALLAERTYVGDDIAGTFELWPGVSPRHPLARAVWPNSMPCSPLHAKAVLEDALLSSGCIYLLSTGLTHVLRDSSGQIAGALVSTSGGLMAVAARVVVDATQHGILLQAAGFSSIAKGMQNLGFVVLGDRPPHASSLGLLQVRVGDTGDKTVPVWLAEISADAGTGEPSDWGRVDSDIRRLVFTPGQLRTADLPHFIEAPLRHAQWVASRLVRAPGDGRAPAERFLAGEALGLRAAQIAAKNPVGRPHHAVCANGAPHQGWGWLPSSSRFTGLPRLALEGVDCWPTLGTWDVAVLGGGTSGAPAGIAAAQGHARCLVLEAAPGLGGVGTQGMIGSYFAGNRVGFTKRVNHGVANMGPNGIPPEKGIWNIEWKAAWYLQELRHANASVWFGSRGAGVRMRDGKVCGFAVTTPWGPGFVDATVSIDASGSAVLAAAANAPVSTIGSDHVAVQGSGLGPREMSVSHCNTDWTFVDDGDPVDLTRAFVAARQKWRGEFDVSQIVDMRERRRIYAEYDVDILDILAERVFPDTIAFTYAPYETHGFTVHPLFMALPPPPKDKFLTGAIPMRSLIPRGVEGLLVVGIGLGAHRDALPVIRMQADVQNIGWAAGLCALRAAMKTGGEVRMVPVSDIQHQLLNEGNLVEDRLRKPDVFPVSDSELDRAIAGGLEDHRSLAIIFSSPARACPRLLARFRSASDPSVKERLAVVLGLLGDDAVAAFLAELVDAEDWDGGWNFAGMEQWGHSLSRMDTLLIALGRTGVRRHAAAVGRKLARLGGDAALSHARSAALAAAGLGDPLLCREVQRLLETPGISGHHRHSIASARGDLDKDPNANRDRNSALRELFLARALWQLGDPEGFAEKILRAYINDLRGHFSRHAYAVLARPVGSAVCWTPEERLANA